MSDTEVTVVFDVGGSRIAAADQHGTLFLLDLEGNRFNTLGRTASPCTSLIFAPSRPNMLLVGLANGSLQCYDAVSGGMLQESGPEHNSSIQCISTNPTNTDAITTAADGALLWDTEGLNKKRTLNGAQDVGVQQVFFVPSGEQVITCFKNDEIMAWDSTSMQLAYTEMAVLYSDGRVFRLPKPSGRQTSTTYLRDFSCSRNGTYLVAGGRSRHLSVWNLRTATLLRAIQLPKTVTAVRKVAFVWTGPGGTDQLVAVLCNDGTVRLIDVVTCRMRLTLGLASRSGPVDSFAVCPHGRYLSALLASGLLVVYDISSALSAAQNRAAGRSSGVNFYPVESTVASAGGAQAAAPAGDQPPPVKAGRKTSKEGSRHVPMGGLIEGKSWEASLRAKEPPLPSKPCSRADYRRRKKAEIAALPEVPSVSETKLYDILRGYGEFPAKYRKYVWRQILSLPENYETYNNLISKGTHPAYESLHQIYPIKSRKMLRIMQRTLSALAHWAPVLGETDYIPSFVFPVVKFFEHDPFVAFEICATLIYCWGQQWFEFFPNPPINVLNMVENLLGHHDPELHRHLIGYGITAQTYAWPLLRTLFSEVFDRDQWLSAMDNLVASHPGYMLHLAVAYSVINRSALLACSTPKDFEYFYHHSSPITILKLTKLAHKYLEKTSLQINPSQLLKDFEPLTEGQYPIVNEYPAFIVNFQVEERARIREEEMEFLRQRAAAAEARKQTERVKHEEIVWQRQQELLLDAEEERRAQIADEDAKLAAQRAKLAAFKREHQESELMKQREQRQRYLGRAQLARKAEMDRLEDAMQMRMRAREGETTAVKADLAYNIALADVKAGQNELALLRAQESQRFHGFANLESSPAGAMSAAYYSDGSASSSTGFGGSGRSPAGSTGQAAPGNDISYADSALAASIADEELIDDGDTGSSTDSGTIIISDAGSIVGRSPSRPSRGDGEQDESSGRSDGAAAARASRPDSAAALAAIARANEAARRQKGDEPVAPPPPGMSRIDLIGGDVSPGLDTERILDRRNFEEREVNLMDHVMKLRHQFALPASVEK